MPPKKPKHRLTELQFDIMQVLWQRGEASVADLQQALARRDEPADSTVATLLHRMEARGLVGHRTQDRLFVYRAAFSIHATRTAPEQRGVNRKVRRPPVLPRTPAEGMLP